MEDFQNLNVTIGERIYPIRVQRGDEEQVKKAEWMINEKFREFQLRYTGQEKIDYLAMSAMMNVIELLKGNSDTNDLASILNEKLDEANAVLQEELHKK